MATVKGKQKVSPKNTKALPAKKTKEVDPALDGIIDTKIAKPSYPIFLALNGKNTMTDKLSGNRNSKSPLK